MSFKKSFQNSQIYASASKQTPMGWLKIFLCVLAAGIAYKIYKGIKDIGIPDVTGLFDGKAAAGNNKEEMAENTKKAIDEISVDYSRTIYNGKTTNELQCLTLADNLYNALHGIGGFVAFWDVPARYRNTVKDICIDCNYVALRGVVKAYSLRNGQFFSRPTTLMGYIVERYRDDHPEYIAELAPMFKAAGFSLS